LAARRNRPEKHLPVAKTAKKAEGLKAKKSPKVNRYKPALLGGKTIDKTKPDLVLFRYEAPKRTLRVAWQPQGRQGGWGDKIT